MKKNLLLLLFYFITGCLFAQKTLLVEKLGGSGRYYYHSGNIMKLRVSRLDTILIGRLWSIHDSIISISELRPFDVRIKDIGSVYKQYAYAKKFGKYAAIGSVTFFAIITFNHLINHQQVFSPDVFIVSGAFLGASLISLSLSEKRCRTDRGWKIKVLDIDVN